MSNHFTATVPVKYTDSDNRDRTRFQRVGVMFQNARRDTGEVFYTLKLDFPVAVHELVMFPPNSNAPED
ncbi:hypothetical protein [uncultured Roseobacter sp.]|uniref:hypothetical protein n=1 Tax=uncultured Roseobacter sp. TaxID=114847 RepID=UPI0026169734|nr:hypothetical protein [uncultured Roseobacter sp.]